MPSPPLLQVVRTSSSTRRRLLHEWRTVLDRIDIMTALVEWQPEDSGKAQLPDGAGQQQASTSACLGLPDVPQHPVLGQGEGPPMPAFGWAVQQQEELPPMAEPSAPAWPG